MCTMRRKSLEKANCPIARSLERVGEWWSILILRDALHGYTRFEEFRECPCEEALCAAQGRGRCRMNMRPDMSVKAEPVAPPPQAEPAAMDPRTRMLLHGPIVPTLLRMAWPNVLVMGAQAATGLIETFWVGRLGTDALAGMALVFPGVMLMQMISAGAMGGGISSAIARALGRGQREEADALVLHAIAINVVLGASFALLVLTFGRPLYALLGGQGA